MSRATMAPSAAVRTALRALGALALIGLLAYAAQAAFVICGRGADDFFETYVYTGLLAAAAALCLARGVLVATERAAWLVLGAGLLAWVAGEVYYSVFLAAMPEPPLPSPSDALWLAFYPAAYVTTVLLLRARVCQFPRGMWLDGLVGALAAAAVGTALVAGPISTGADPTTIAVDLTYLLADLVLLGVLIAAITLSGWRPGRALGLVALGLATGALVDGFYLHQAATGQELGGTLPAVLWPASTLLLGAAAWQRPRAAPARLEGWRVLALPAVFALAALAVLAFGWLEPLPPTAAVLAGATLLAVIVRMSRALAENLKLLERSRREALTDPLTRLGNRRLLMEDLERTVAEARERAPRALMSFDLDGFKDYNDHFGHPMGDALLARLGRRLAESVRGSGQAYRLGGDEFCVLATGDEARLRALSERARAALSEEGEGFAVGSSCGTVLLPREAEDVALALHLADERLYAQKGTNRRRSVSRQTGDALLQALKECDPAIGGHLHEVAQMSRALGERLGIAPAELEELARAAELHDIGKVAVPTEILRKPGPLDESEWDFVYQHTLVGDRILSAAPDLRHVARIVRATHERFDGSGYPDRVAGEDIPLAARIVAVCDAYHAMTSERPYEPAIPPAKALAELRRCAGTQFDPAVVSAFCEMIGPGDRAPASRTAPFRRPAEAA